MMAFENHTNKLEIKLILKSCTHVLFSVVPLNTVLLIIDVGDY